MNVFNGVVCNNVEFMRFCSFGGWVEQLDDLQLVLKGYEYVDVVVVGVGFVGLLMVLELRVCGVNVIVLEQQFVGFGVSGCNVGYLFGSMGIECEVFVK